MFLSRSWIRTLVWMSWRSIGPYPGPGHPRVVRPASWVHGVRDGRRRVPLRDFISVNCHLLPVHLMALFLRRCRLRGTVVFHCCAFWASSVVRSSPPRVDRFFYSLQPVCSGTRPLQCFSMTPSLISPHWQFCPCFWQYLFVCCRCLLSATRRRDVVIFRTVLSQWVKSEKHPTFQSHSPLVTWLQPPAINILV